MLFVIAFLVIFIATYVLTFKSDFNEDDMGIFTISLVVLVIIAFILEVI